MEMPKKKIPAYQREAAKTDQFDLSLRGSKPLYGRNTRQKGYLANLKGEANVVFGVGPAGTGKTYLAASYAVDQLAMKRIDKIVLTRATVPVSGEQLGFLPGTLEKKMEPWTQEIMDVFEERVGKDAVRRWMLDGRIQIVPFAFMRGRTFKNAIVFCDEIQNATPAQAKMLVTRIGDGTRYFINGDLEQSDLLGANGLAELLGMVERFSLPFPVSRFTSAEVERSETCRLWVEAYEKMKLECSDVVPFPRSSAS
jgi:phosphate starvation-inducible protein PhoH and related proteins